MKGAVRRLILDDARMAQRVLAESATSPVEIDGAPCYVVRAAGTFDGFRFWSDDAFLYGPRMRALLASYKRRMRL